MLRFFKFSKTKTEGVNDFAEKLAQQIVKRYPPLLDQQPGKRPSVSRLTRIIEDACAKALEFQQQQNLGVFGKAKLGNEFRWALLEAGYSKEFSALATEAIIVWLSRGRAQEGTEKQASGKSGQ